MTLLKDLDVVAVQMHRMNHTTMILDNNAKCRIGAVIVHVVNVGEGEVARLGLLEDRIVVVDSHSAAVLVPEQIGAIGHELDHDRLGE